MNTIKKFYNKNIMIFTILLVLILAFLGYLIYTRWSKTKEQTLETPKKDGEDYRYIGTGVQSYLAEEAISGGKGYFNPETGLANVDFMGRGITGADPLDELVRTTGQSELGVSAIYDPRTRGAGKILGYTAYDKADVSDIGKY